MANLDIRDSLEVSSEAESSIDTETSPNEKNLSPPYVPMLTTSPTSTSDTAKLPPIQPCNFLSIRRVNEAISGRWRLDTNLVSPTSGSPPSEDEEYTRPHLDLYSKNSYVSADIELEGRDERAVLKAESLNGSVTVKIKNPNSQRIDLLAHSYNEGVYVYIPRSFNGPISGETRNGTVTFSKEIQRHLTSFSECTGDKSGFLGEFQATEYGKKWDKDICVAETFNGSIKFSFIDEDTSGLSGGDFKRFWSRLFGRRNETP